MFGIFLFVIVYTFLIYFYAPAPEAKTATSSSVDVPVKDVIVTDYTVTDSPLPSGLSSVAVTPQVTEEKSTDINTVIEDLLDGVEISDITLRKARKIAKALNIRQSVKGKSQPKAWLVAQITKKLKANPQDVAPVIVAKVRAAA